MIRLESEKIYKKTLKHTWYTGGDALQEVNFGMHEKGCSEDAMNKIFRKEKIVIAFVYGKKILKIAFYAHVRA